MEVSEQDIALIDQYINGELTAEDISLLELRLQSEEALQEIYANMSMLPAAMHQSVTEEKLDLLRGLESTMEAEISDHQVDSAHTNRMINMRSWMSIAAGLLILISATWWWSSQPTPLQREVAGLYELSDTPPVDRPTWIKITRGEGKTMENVDPALIRAYNLYEIGSYELAASALDEYYQKTGDREAQFYAGISYGAIGELQKAKEYIEGSGYEVEDEKFVNELIEKIK